MSARSPRRPFGVADLAQFGARLAELRLELTPPPLAGNYVAHTDGACLGNPEGPGGWAAVVEASVDEPARPWLLWGHLSSTSNNRAEALGVLAALEWVPADSRLTVYSDSELTVRILRGQYKVKANPEIWELIRRVIGEKHLELHAEWVRGHAGDPRNELADRLSKLGARNGGASDESVLSADGLDLPAIAAEPSELQGLSPRGDWEREFVQSVSRQLRARRALSPKQQAVIDRIRARGAPDG